MNDFMNRKLKNGYTLTVKAMGDDTNFAGKIFKMSGIRFDEISQLSFNSSDTSYSTFTVQCTVAETQMQYSQIEKKEGLLSKIDSVASTVSNILGR